MATTQYIGSRYVPLFADPAEWNNIRAYEPLTIVLHEGNSYTSKQYVPNGIDISNEEFWAETGNYNAQVEQYRREVATFDGRITANAEDIATMKPTINTIANSKKTYLIMGDSWTAANDNLNHLNYAAWSRNLCHDYDNIYQFGHGGWNLTDFLNELDEAADSTEFTNESVERIYVVGGVNEGVDNPRDKATKMNTFCTKAKTLFKNADVTWAMNCYSCLHNILWATAITTAAYIMNYTDNKFTFIPLPIIMNIPAMYSHDENDATWNEHKIVGFHPSDWATPMLERLALNVFTGQNELLYTSIGLNESVGATLLAVNYNGTQTESKELETLSNGKLTVTTSGNSFVCETDRVFTFKDNHTYGSIGFCCKIDDVPNLRIPLPYISSETTLSNAYIESKTTMNYPHSIYSNEYMNLFNNLYIYGGPTISDFNVDIKIVG